MKTKFLFVTLLFLNSTTRAQLAAEKNKTEIYETEIYEIVVVGKNESPLRLKKDEISRVERIKKRDIESKKIQTFAQAIDNERGVDTQTSCAFCGAKRISINGLKGEHTTILVDGLALHSTVSGFYGVEAIPLSGIESIDIYRGSGAALAVPESIGGAVNIVTTDPFIPLKEFKVNISNDGQKNISAAVAATVSPSSAIFLSAEAGDSLSIDQDQNGVTEQPHQKTLSFLGKYSAKINDTGEASVRVSVGQLKTFGGSPNDLTLSGPTPKTVNSNDFLNKDVRNKYIGDAQKITDNLNLDRIELATQYRKQIDASSSLKLSLGGATQNQKAIYSHGYDYDNKDNLVVALAEYQRVLTEQHLMTIGFDHKSENMKSESQYLYGKLGLKHDDLVLKTYGGYIQDTWIIDENREVALVLRADQIRTQWTDLGNTLDKSVVAPRLYYKHIHNSELTSRVGLGVGYRSPLTLFESQHGTDHNGFMIEIDKIETAKSVMYSLAGQRHDDFFELSAHLTQIENMAYGEDRADQDLPTIFKNSPDNYLISVFDLSYGRRFTEDWSLEGLIEVFNYPKDYKAKLPVAALEKRFTLSSNWQLGKWASKQKFVLVPEQDLSSYGYEDHYNVAFTDDDILSSTFGQSFYSEQKRQKSPTYWTFDLDFDREISTDWSAGFAIKNLFDYTQTSAGDSPLTWDKHGDHYHIDNFHIWGPLRGRQIFLSLRGSF